MTDILLIQPPIRDFYLTTKRTIPYGLAGIASTLGNAGFSVELFDALATGKSRVLPLPAEMDYLEPYYARQDFSPFALFHKFKHFGYSYQHLGNEIRRSGAFLVGISSLFTPYCKEALRVAEIAKQQLPDCKVVLGGHHPTALPEAVLESSAVDYVLRGEGELSMPLLAAAVKNGCGVRDVPGIVYRRKYGGFHISEPVFVKNLDRLALPAIDLINNRYYRKKKKGSWIITASRGCPLRCTYCVLGTSLFPYRRRSVSSVIAEIDAAVREHDGGFIDFEDEHLTIDKRWFLELMAEISGRYRNRKLELRAMNGLYPPSLDTEIIDAMKKAGFRALNLSLGTISKHQLKRFQRVDVRRKFEEAVQYAAAIGLEAVGYIIVGTPGQSAADSVVDLLFLWSLPAIVGVSVFYPAPGSVEYDRARQKGLLPHSFSLMRSSAVPISDTTSRKQSITLLRLGRILNFIKSLSTDDILLPTPAPVGRTLVGKGISDLQDRHQVGIRLLSAFLHDGSIRGVSPDGDVFEHDIDRFLTEMFLKGIKQ